jgi:REP element-mobilizing transposase RayT
MYFVTICVQRGLCLLDKTAVQAMIQHWWPKLPDKFAAVETDAFVIMPNHLHFIVAIVDGAGKSGQEGNTQAPAPTLGRIVQWFKTMTTNAYIRGVKKQRWEPFPGRLWQRNYYEQIIRNERHLTAVRQYIDNNPLNWEADDLHPQAPSNKFNQLWRKA